MTIDSALNSTSENPVQNKIINGALDTINTAINNLSSITIVTEENIPSAGTLNEGDIVLVYEE